VLPYEIERSYMFLINITYKKSLEIIDQYLVAHRAFLEEGYQKNYFVVSGPKNPRVGGVIISQLTDRQQLEAILRQDPFVLHEVADYEITEFAAVKYHPQFACFVAD
jgi:uncharacterized protein YciI